MHGAVFRNVERFFARATAFKLGRDAVYLQSNVRDLTETSDYSKSSIHQTLSKNFDISQATMKLIRPSPRSSPNEMREREFIEESEQIDATLKWSRRGHLCDRHGFAGSRPTGRYRHHCCCC